MEFEVDDGLFDRLVNKHKDLPDEIKRQVFARDNFTCVCCGKVQLKHDAAAQTEAGASNV